MKKILVVLVCCLFAVTVLSAENTCMCATGERAVKKPGVNMFQNLLKTAKFSDAGMGKCKLVDEDYLLMMQVALKQGQKVPQHYANSNVHIVVLTGKLIITLAGREFIIEEHDFIPIVEGTPMSIENKYKGDASFIIIKTPHPKKFKKSEKTIKNQKKDKK
ncbi:hypothetical protein KAJ27_06245 [bacterium]|nr:hypothetical protein [bacterium]